MDNFYKQRWDDWFCLLKLKSRTNDSVVPEISYGNNLSSLKTNENRVTFDGKDNGYNGVKR